MKSLQQELETLQKGITKAVTGTARAIHGSAEVAKTSILKSDNQTALDFVNRIQMNAERMESMLAAADLYRRMAGGIPEKSWLQLEELVRTEVRNQAPELLSLLALDTPQQCRVFADPAMCKEVIKALVSNAITHSKNQNRPLIFFRKVLEMEPCVFVLGNTGKGIPQDEAPGLFGLFETGNESASEGIGMGLSLARMLTEKHGGKVWMESRVNDGTRVFFHFGNDSQPKQA